MNQGLGRPKQELTTQKLRKGGQRSLCMELMIGWVKIMHALLALSGALPNLVRLGNPQGDSQAE